MRAIQKLLENAKALLVLRSKEVGNNNKDIKGMKRSKNHSLPYYTHRIGKCLKANC